MKILLSGYRIAGYECLKYLIENKADIVAVLTDDNTTDPIKINPEKSTLDLAKEHGIPVYLPKDNAIIQHLKENTPDVHICAFYGKKIPEEIIDLIPININIHGGRIPEYKGCMSHVWSIINGERTTGVTLQTMGKEIDSGETIKMVEINIKNEDTGGDLYYKITDTAIELFKEIYKKLKAGETIESVAPTYEGNYYKKGLPNNGYLSWYTPAKKAYNFIRALDFPPLEPAYTTIGGKKIYLYTKKVKQ